MEDTNRPVDEMIEEDGIITLTDEDGATVDFEFLDLLNYEGASYAVVVPVEDETDTVQIFRVEGPDQEENSFIPVVDEETAMAVFELFKEKNKDDFDFA